MKKVTVERTWRVRDVGIVFGTRQEDRAFYPVERASITPKGRKALEEAKAKKG